MYMIRARVGLHRRLFMWGWSAARYREVRPGGDRKPGAPSTVAREGAIGPGDGPFAGPWQVLHSPRRFSLHDDLHALIARPGE